MSPESTFTVDVPRDVDPGQTLVVGLSSVGMAGVTATDYLVRHLDSAEVGHVSSRDMPAITPFENGRPRHHTRVYNLLGSDLTVLVGELFVPVPAARSFTDALLEWAAAAGVAEVAVLHSVPFPHGPDEHTVFHVATDGYREARLDSTDIRPLKGGFLDGVPGDLLGRGLDGDAPPVGVFATPAHPPGPDTDAALLLLDAIEEVYDVAVDRTELEGLSEEIKQHYASLADRMAAIEEADDRDFAEDRMYM